MLKVTSSAVRFACCHASRHLKHLSFLPRLISLPVYFLKSLSTQCHLHRSRSHPQIINFGNSNYTLRISSHKSTSYHTPLSMEVHTTAKLSVVETRNDSPQDSSLQTNHNQAIPNHTICSIGVGELTIFSSIKSLMIPDPHPKRGKLLLSERTRKIHIHIIKSIIYS